MTTTDRFRADLDALAAPGARLGIALSGGPDSLALLLLAAAARPGQSKPQPSITRSAPTAAPKPRPPPRSAPGSAFRMSFSPPSGPTRPITAIQERARAERYRLLAGWAEERGLDAILTGHHADDQAETLLMRLNRGAGVRGLGGMRRRVRSRKFVIPANAGTRLSFFAPSSAGAAPSSSVSAQTRTSRPTPIPATPTTGSSASASARRCPTPTGSTPAPSPPAPPTSPAPTKPSIGPRTANGAEPSAKRTVASPTCLRMRQPKSSAASSREPSQRWPAKAPPNRSEPASSTPCWRCYAAAVRPPCAECSARAGPNGASLQRPNGDTEPVILSPRSPTRLVPGADSPVLQPCICAPPSADALPCAPQARAALKSYEVEEVEDPPIPSGQGDTPAGLPGAGRGRVRRAALPGAVRASVSEAGDSLDLCRPTCPAPVHLSLRPHCYWVRMRLF